MAKSESFRVNEDMVPVVLALATGSDDYRRFKGVSVSHQGGGLIQMYGGNNSERAEFQRLSDSAIRARTNGADGSLPATDKQISYLTTLIQNDPGTATTIGASPDGSRVTANMSRAKASRLIDMMKSGV